MSDNLLDDLCRSYLGEKIKRQNILNQNGANLVFLHAQDVASKLKLAEDLRQNITPYPSTTFVMNEQPPAQPEEKPSLARRLLPAAVAAAVGLGGVGLGSYLTKPDEPAAVEQQQIDPKVGIEVR